MQPIIGNLCCKKATNNVCVTLSKSRLVYHLACDATEEELAFCPFCGSKEFGRPARGLYVTFDVDGVLANDNNGDTSIPYTDRRPYPWVARRVQAIKDQGHTITIQTARYMRQTGGDQLLAHQNGYAELCGWLDECGIPHDRVYLGKASSDIFVDDRAFHLNSNEGEAGWDKLDLRLAELSRSR